MNFVSKSFFWIVIILFIFTGCNSLPKNITQDEYDSVRNYVSINISGMTYSELLNKLDRQHNLPYSGEREYNDYLMSISNKMNELTDEYTRTDQQEGFYSWAMRNM